MSLQPCSSMFQISNLQVQVGSSNACCHLMQGWLHYYKPPGWCFLRPSAVGALRPVGTCSVDLRTSVHPANAGARCRVQMTAHEPFKHSMFIGMLPWMFLSLLAHWCTGQVALPSLASVARALKKSSL
jgi:hypothetical protein